MNAAEEINQDIDYSRYGPWDIKLRAYIDTQPAMVLIHNLDKDTIEKEFRIDLGNSEDKKFLGKITFWSITNGRSVETMSIEDYEKHFK